MMRGDHVSIYVRYSWRGCQKGRLSQRYAKDLILVADRSVRRCLRSRAAGPSVLAQLKAAAKPSLFGPPDPGKVILGVI